MTSKFQEYFIKDKVEKLERRLMADKHADPVLRELLKDGFCIMHLKPRMMEMLFHEWGWPWPEAEMVFKSWGWHNEWNLKHRSLETSTDGYGI